MPRGVYERTPETRAAIRAARLGQESPGVAAANRRRVGANSPTWKGDDIGPIGVHHRLRKKRGSAMAHACVDCLGLAAHWSYAGGDPDERYEPGYGWFTTNLDAHEPRCGRCHYAHDEAIWGRGGRGRGPA